ncbi:uncharacterized, partial [Tachysurus ichikawai]
THSRVDSAVDEEPRIYRFALPITKHASQSQHRTSAFTSANHKASSQSDDADWLI